MAKDDSQLTKSDRRRRAMPVVIWLQAGAAVAAAGIALSAAPTATADDGGATTTSTSAAAERSTAVRGATTARRSAQPAAAAAKIRAAKNSAAKNSKPSASAAELPSIAAPVAAVTTSPAAGIPSLAASAPAQPTASVTAPAPPSASPGLGAFSAALRLNIESLFSGGAPKVTNPTTVVKGLFNQVLRRDPTPTETQNYVTDMKFFGVNAVVAGLYSSDAFRQNAVDNYYRELLGRAPTEQEQKSGVFTYTFDSVVLKSPESYVASVALAGGQEFYDYSASGGGPYGSKPTATSYVNLLYRSLLGEPTGPEAAPLIQSVEKGLPNLLAANQFVKTYAYRTVKVGQVYEVLGQTASATDVASYVKNWIWKGGQAGISQSLLATSANISRIDAGLVTLPDVASAALLANILLLPYGNPDPEAKPSSPFVDALKQQLQKGEDSAQGELNGCKGTQKLCNVPFYTLMSTGGLDRGIPNNALQWSSPVYDQVSKLIPTQSNVDMDQSLVYPLRDPTTAALYLKGGQIDAPGGIILSADNGQYVIDGHHRWSALYVVNPNGTSIRATDLGYVPNPESALKETQIAIGALEGYLPWKAVDGENLYTVPQQLFNDKVFEYIWALKIVNKDPTLVDRQDATAGPGVDRPQVFNEFTQFLTGSIAIPGVPEGALTLQQQVEYTKPIQDYLWGNVVQMRQTNNPIPDATPRADMPQPENNQYPPYLNLLDTGQVIYTLPAISAMG